MNNNNKKAFPSFRTDLAYEATLRMECTSDSTNTESTCGNVKITKTVVGLCDGEKMCKKPGTYYTIDLSSTNFHDFKSSQEIEISIMKTLKSLLEEHNLIDKKCLVIGLGNINVTPDSLGPYVLDNIVITRHLFELDTVNVGYSVVSGISPGVMGSTGIETFDIISSVVKEIKVDYVIVVDALAAANLSRVNKTIQITDTGISPGSGVGNKRKELSYDTLGIPVIAIGVPTVVDAATITSDTMDYILKYLNHKANKKDVPASKLSIEPMNVDYEKVEDAPNKMKEHLMGQIGLLDEQQIKTLIEDVLTPNGFNMMVTPKEIDADIEDLAKIIAMGIDITLHKSIRDNYLKE